MPVPQWGWALITNSNNDHRINTMNLICKVPDCGEEREGRSSYCTSHKTTMRRHGDALQAGVTITELKPYRKKIAARRAKNPHSPLWTILRERWDVVVQSARKTLDAFYKGKPSGSHEVKAADAIVRTADNTEPDEVIDTAMAVFLLQEAKPRRFITDKAFRFQLARRVRGTTGVNAGTYYDPATAKVKRVYRDMAPRTLEAFAAPLAAAFGVAALRLAELDRREVERAQSDKAKFEQALKELK